VPGQAKQVLLARNLFAFNVRNDSENCNKKYDGSYAKKGSSPKSPKNDPKSDIIDT